jgi:medium-chain acyl-[acyl-carrier-protein] hydrolase
MTTSPAPTSRWIARRRMPSEPKARLLCIPHVGGGAAVFNGWIDRVPPHVELCAVRFPGRENRLAEPLCEDWRTLMTDLESVATPLFEVPTVIVGHCSGSVLAYELARRSRTGEGAGPVAVVLSSTPAPGLRDRDDLHHLLSRDELLARVVDYGGMSPAVLDDPDLMTMFERILRADYRIVEQLEYSAGPPLDIPLAVLGGRHDPFVRADALMAWSAETTSNFSLHLIDAGHFMLDAVGAHVAGVMSLLREKL